MTECENAEIRDLLPDFANGLLPLVEAERVRTHVYACSACSEELEILYAMRAMPIARVVVNEAAIVAKLSRTSVKRAPRSGVWRMAAAIGVMVLGGWSVFLVRSGGLTFAMNNRSDSLALSDTPASAVSSTTLPTPSSAAKVAAPGRVDDSATRLASSKNAGVAVSYGGMSDLTDEELQRVLDRLDKWDGATSTETTGSATPILPVKTGGLEP